MFKLVAGVTLDLNKVLCTEKLCSWKKSRKKANPTPLKFVNFKRPKKGDTMPTVQDAFEGKLRGHWSPDPVKFCTEQNLQKLCQYKRAAPNAVLWKNTSMKFEDSDDELTETADETEDFSLPEPITSMYDPSAINMNPEDIINFSEKKYHCYLSNNSQKNFDNLCYITKTQSHNQNWKLHRCGRITATFSKTAYNLKLDNPAKSFISSIMQYNKDFTTKAMKHGITTESLARKTYFDNESKNHDSFTVEETGLCVNANFPCLGASPDGIVKCKCHKVGLLEIKCPYKHKTLHEWKEDKLCPIDNTDKMKRNHTYYYQVQHQMLITGFEHCDFFVYFSNTKEFYLSRVNKDPVFCGSLKEKLLKTFQKVVLLEVISRKNDPKLEHLEELYCICKRPSFPPMIACDGENCKIEWFHFSCVDLKKTPKTWYCKECQVD